MTTMVMIIMVIERNGGGGVTRDGLKWTSFST